MKKTLMIASLLLAVSPAMASKARVAAIAGAPHIEDIQDILDNPGKLLSHGDWLTFEMGESNPAWSTVTATPAVNPEGGFARGAGDAKYGFYLGNHDVWVTEVRDGAYLTNENPVDLFYGRRSGDLNWGVGLTHSSTDKKTTQEKQTATGLKVGATGQNWEAGAIIGLANTYKNDATGVDFKGKTAMSLAGIYSMETLSYRASYAMNGGKEETNGTATGDDDLTTMSVGVSNSHKVEGSDFFYGVDYVMTTQKDNQAGTKTDITSLPVYAGIEADATSWMVLRASLKQNVLLGGTKTDAGTDTIANNTTVAAGAGFKFNKLQMDATIAGQNSGAINGTALLSNASLTYLF